MAYEGPKVFSAEVKEEVERREMKNLLRGVCVIHHWALAAFAQALEGAAKERRSLQVLRNKLLPAWRKGQVVGPEGSTRIRQKYYVELPTEQVLVRHQLCGLLGQKDLFRVSHSLALVSAPKGTVLLTKGVESTKAYLLKTGSVTRDDGTTLKQGWIGDTPASVEDIMPALWNVEVTEDAVLWVMDISRVERILSEEGKKVAKSVARGRIVRRMEEGGLGNDVLRQSRLFGEFSEVDLNAITAAAVPHYIPPMETIFEQGQPATLVYLLISGTVESTETLESHRSKTKKINLLEPTLIHNLLGAEDALLTTSETPHTTTLTAVTGCRLWSIPVYHLRPYFASSPKEFSELRKSLLQKLNTRRSHFDVKLPLQLLKSCATFSEWPVQLLTEVNRLLKPISFQQGRMITDKKTDAAAVYIITKGEALVMGGAKTNNSFGVRLEPCSLIGFWEVMFTTANRQNIKCLTPCEAYYLNPEDFKRIYSAISPLPLDWVSRVQNEALQWCVENSETLVADRLRAMKNMDFCDTYLAPPSFINLRRQPITNQERLLRQDEIEASERRKLVERMKEHLAKDPSYMSGNLNLQAVRDEMKNGPNTAENLRLMKRRMFIEDNRKRFGDFNAQKSPRPPSLPKTRKPVSKAVLHPPIKPVARGKDITDVSLVKPTYSSVFSTIVSMKQRQMALMTSTPPKAPPQLYSPTPPPHLQALDKSAYRGYRGKSLP
eukprot:TRINITY_DN108_c1_g1_i2.p1 TRINITY_DN108_c1_g1~~TRINITY_DN108_c1_g1_i2.p1  ORF type:complete len:719 (+),score=97.05 TRINITY_DN108_c1_g1_i2:187-2343(+)